MSDNFNIFVQYEERLLYFNSVINQLTAERDEARAQKDIMAEQLKNTKIELEKLQNKNDK